MRNRRYRLTLRKISTRSVVEDDYEIEVKSVDDIKCAVSSLGEYSKLLLCLGPYEMGTVNTYSDDFIHLNTFFNVISYSDPEGSGYIIGDAVLKLLVNRKICLEEFIETVFSEYYQVEIARNAKTAWWLLQNGWKCVARIVGFMNPLLVSELRFSQEKRLIFLKGRKH